MAWWIPLMAAAASMKQNKSKQDEAELGRLKYSQYSQNRFSSETPGNGMTNMGQSSSLLSSVFGIDKKKGDDNLGLDKVNDTGMGSRIRLQDFGDYGEGYGGW